MSNTIMGNENQNIIDNLNKKTNRNLVFSVPKDYFESLEDEILATLKEEKFVKTSAFEVPNSYFDALENSILANLSSTIKGVKVISFKEKLLNVVSIAAASILLFIGINTFVFSKKTNSFDELADSDVENWISNNIHLVNDTDLAYTDINFDESEIILNSISNDELENFLVSEEDISLILEIE